MRSRATACQSASARDATGSYQRLDLFIKVLWLFCPNLTDSSGARFISCRALFMSHKDVIDCPLVVLYLAIGRRVGASARSYQRLQTISSSKFIAHARSIFQALVIPWLLMEQRAGEGWNKPVKEKDMMITGGNQETRVPAARHGDHEHRRYQEHALALRGAGSQACDSNSL